MFNKQNSTCRLINNIKMKKLYLIFGMILFLISCNKMQRMNEKPISVEATFMQYACGDWNDDMRIDIISDTSLNYLVGTDIDPEMINGDRTIGGWLYDNKTIEYGYRYKLTGYISKSAKSGCENCTPKFWIEKIEKLNGEKFDMSSKN